MQTTKYISIKSVLFNLSLIIDERYWNEINIMEWATSALRTMNIIPLLEDKVKVIELCEHKATLPSDMRFLTQVAYYDSTLPLVTLDDSVATTYPWVNMRLSSSPFALSICLDKSITQCTHCTHHYSLSPDMTLTSSARNGSLMVAYKSFPVAEDGSALIPDDETLKQALLNYVLYNYWMVKYQMKEEGADQRMQFHLSMWSTLSKKAMNLNRPTIGQLDNIMRVWNHLVPTQNRMDHLMTTLTNAEDYV